MSNGMKKSYGVADEPSFDMDGGRVRFDELGEGTWFGSEGRRYFKLMNGDMGDLNCFTHDGKGCFFCGDTMVALNPESEFVAPQIPVSELKELVAYWRKEASDACRSEHNWTPEEAQTIRHCLNVCAGELEDVLKEGMFSVECETPCNDEDE